MEYVKFKIKSWPHAQTMHRSNYLIQIVDFK